MKDWKPTEICGSCPRAPREETLHFSCTCEKIDHYEDARYCIKCGKKKAEPDFDAQAELSKVITDAHEVQGELSDLLARIRE